MRVNTYLATGLLEEDKDTRFNDRMKLDIYLTGRWYSTFSRRTQYPFTQYDAWLSRYRVYLNNLNR